MITNSNDTSAPVLGEVRWRLLPSLDAAPWLEALTVQEQLEMVQAVGGLESLTPRERVAFFLADFKLMDTAIYLERKKIQEFSQEVAEKIMDFCFHNMQYVPMVYYNTRFTGGYTLERRGSSCPNVALEDIVMDRILGYREKIDGVHVFTARITKDGATVECWAGGISSPKYERRVHQFEMKGDKCYSIEPFNATGQLVFSSMVFTFETRSLEFAVNPEWREGAIAIVATPSFPVEKRVKRIATGEVLVRDGYGMDDKGKYPMMTPVPNGVWECAWDGSKLVPQAFRPWKLPSRNYFKVVGVPTVHALRPIARREVHTVKGPLRATPNAIYLPPVVEFKPVLTQFSTVPQAEPKLYRQPTGGEPVECEIYFTGLDFQGAMAPYSNPYPGAPKIGFSIPVNLGTVSVGPTPYFVRSKPQEGTVVTTGAYKLIAGSLTWDLVIAQGANVEKKATMTQADFEGAYQWAMFTPYYARRYFRPHKVGPLVSTCQRTDRVSCSLDRVPAPPQPAGILVSRQEDQPSPWIQDELLPTRQFPRVRGDRLTEEMVDKALAGAPCMIVALYDRLRKMLVNVSEADFAEWLNEHPEYGQEGAAVFPRVQDRGIKRSREAPEV